MVHCVAVLLLAGALGFCAWCLSLRWDGSLRDGHEFRQFQTALTAYYFKKDGLKLAYETPVLGAPWSIPMEFPVYQAVVAGLSSGLDLPLEQAGRLTSILFFVGCIPAVLLLLQKRLPYRSDRMIVAASLLLCPLFLFYSRTFLIESTALCFTLWFLALFDRALAQPLSAWLPAAWVLGALAAATKVTTFAVAVLPAILIVIAVSIERKRAGERWIGAIRSPLLRALAISLPPSLVGLAWIAYSDQLKALNPYGQVLTSDSLATFNLGTLDQRLSWAFWQKMGAVSLNHVITGTGLLVLVGGIGAVTAPYRRLALACIAAYSAGFLIFANLYFVHDYYFYASATFLVAALGIISAGLLRSPRVPRTMSVILVLAGFGSQIPSFMGSYHGFYERPNPPPPALAAVLKAVVQPDDAFAAFGLDWGSILPYYAERRAIMVYDSHSWDRERFTQSLSKLDGRKVTALVIADKYRQQAKLILPLFAELDLDPQPIASADNMDLYVATTRFQSALASLKPEDYPGTTLNLSLYQLRSGLSEVQDLTTGDWPQRLWMMSPAPHLSRGYMPIQFSMLDQAQVVSTHAPNELYVRPPAGARTIEATVGMFSASYEAPNETDGVTFEIHLERPDGQREVLVRRVAMPLHNPADRGDLELHYTSETPLDGILVLCSYPGPFNNQNFDWAYWRKFEVR
ncbi:hypothetical protein MASR2M8_21590 [Opitutaceae bacterium]